MKAIENHRNIRIAIIGAGPAGLTAAEELKEKGYTNITIFEKEKTAGGKCSSFKYEGRSYELGAGVIAANNHAILKLAKKFAVKIASVDFVRPIIFLDTKTGKPLNEKRSFKEKLAFFRQFLKYRKLLLHNRKITEPGFENADKKLSIPFSEWAEKYNIQIVAKELAYFFTGWGYGYFDEIPAAYVLKYYSWGLLKSFIKKTIYHFPNGIQQLWTSVAKNHNVLYQSSIQKIERGNNVKITFENGTTKNELEFDTIILACPMDNSLQFLAPSVKEKTLFSKIKYCDYRVYALFLKNFPANDGYISDNFSASRKGHPVFWYQRYVDSNLYTFYVLGDEQMTDEEILKNIENVVQGLGGKIESLHRKAHWKYFPHISPEDFQNGYFDELENLQGVNKTYYTGELLNFSTVDLSASYSKKLIETHF